MIKICVRRNVFINIRVSLWPLCGSNSIKDAIDQVKSLAQSHI